MGPVYRETHDADLAWRVSLVAGLIGRYRGNRRLLLRRMDPQAHAACRAALRAGRDRITFIAMGFILQIFSSPLVAVFPAMLVLIGYGGRVRWPLGLPTGFVAIVAGTAVAWMLRGLQMAPTPPWPVDAHLKFYPPVPITHEFAGLITDPRVWAYAAVFVPMAVLNVVGSMLNLESAEAAGDKFDTRSSLLVNGVSAVVGVFLGNPFAPTIYIGHPGWKALGARSGYSVLNAVAITAICLTGALPFILWYLPMEAALGILLWIGLIIMAQAFQEVKVAHAPAVAFGFIPALAAWLSCSSKPRSASPRPVTRFSKPRPTSPRRFISTACSASASNRASSCSRSSSARSWPTSSTATGVPRLSGASSPRFFPPAASSTATFSRPAATSSPRSSTGPVSASPRPPASISRSSTPSSRRSSSPCTPCVRRSGALKDRDGSPLPSLKSVKLA